MLTIFYSSFKSFLLYTTLSQNTDLFPPFPPLSFCRFRLYIVPFPLDYLYYLPLPSFHSHNFMAHYSQTSILAFCHFLGHFMAVFSTVHLLAGVHVARHKYFNSHFRISQTKYTTLNGTEPRYCAPDLDYVFASLSWQEMISSVAMIVLT